MIAGSGLNQIGILPAVARLGMLGTPANMLLQSIASPKPDRISMPSIRFEFVVNDGSAGYVTRVRIQCLLVLRVGPLENRVKDQRVEI